MSSSSNGETTYSDDCRYELDRAEELKREALRKELNEENRKRRFEQKRQTLEESEDSVFHYAGLTFLHFDHTKIKFRMIPSQFRDDLLVSTRVKFYCSIYYSGEQWRIRRNSVPILWMRQINNIFFAPGSPPVTDSTILDAVERIYGLIKEWTEEHHLFRSFKYARWCLGHDDVVLDSDDDELFFTDEEVAERKAKQQEIWQRMLPPK